MWNKVSQSKDLLEEGYSHTHTTCTWKNLSCWGKIFGNVWRTRAVREAREICTPPRGQKIGCLWEEVMRLAWILRAICWKQPDYEEKHLLQPHFWLQAWMGLISDGVCRIWKSRREDFSSLVEKGIIMAGIRSDTEAIYFKYITIDTKLAQQRHESLWSWSVLGFLCNCCISVIAA